jgi:hypothetical protein
MSRILPFEGLLMNLRREIPASRKRQYLTPEQARDSLMRRTNQDFGLDADRWEEWLRLHHPEEFELAEILKKN